MGSATELALIALGLPAAETRSDRIMRPSATG